MRELAFLHGHFNVLGIAIHAANDDHILEPTSHEDFTFVAETEIAGAEKMTRRGNIDELCPKGLFGGFLLLPIAQADEGFAPKSRQSDDLAIACGYRDRQ